MRLIYTLIKIFFAVILIFVFIAGGVFIILTFGKTSYDTTGITNAGFAIFAGCSSVCFSWARHLQERDEKKYEQKITIYGESLFLSALCFVIASLLKYIIIHKDALLSESILNSTNFIFPVLNAMGTLMFLVAYINAWGAVTGLLHILFKSAFYNHQH